MSRLNIVLASLLVVVLLMTALSGVDYSRPNFEILPDMKYSPASSAFSKNVNFINGRTLQAPAPGTIARGELPLHFAATKEDAIRAGEEIVNPYSQIDDIEIDDIEIDDVDQAIEEPPSPAADSSDSASAEAGVTKPPEPITAEQKEKEEQAKRLALARDRLQKSSQRGDHVYRSFCVSCHGSSGLGDGPVTKRGFPPPPSLLTGKSAQMKDGQLFHILTYGQGSMSSMAPQLPRGNRWDVINYVRDLQRRAPAPPAVVDDKKTEPSENEKNEPDERKTTDAKKTDAKKTDAKKTDAKKTDAKKTDAKKTDAKKTDAKKTDAKKTDAKKSDAKKADAKKADAKKADAKKADAKKTDTKKADTKKADTKKADAKKTDDEKKSDEKTRRPNVLRGEKPPQ